MMKILRYMIDHEGERPEKFKPHRREQMLAPVINAET